MQQLYEKYEKDGLSILALPCNQFGGQEPEPVDAILKKTSEKFGRTFPLQAKVDIHGPEAIDLYKMLDPKENYVTWNFGKYLADREGHIVGYYAPKISPLAMEKDIELLLNKK